MSSSAVSRTSPSPSRVGSANYIETGAGDDRLEGGDGDDTLLGGAGDNTIDGGNGLDRIGVDLSSHSTDFMIDLNGTSTLLTGELSNSEAFQDLKTGSGNDVITGHETSFLPDTIAAGAGDDTITLWNASERDAVDGGVGDDRLVVTGDAYLALSGITENLEGGYDGSYSTGYSNEGVYFGGVEHFSFTDGSGLNNYIETGAGDDRLEGGDGDDTLLGGAGDNTIDGGNGLDRIGVDLSSHSTDFMIDLNGTSTLLTGELSNSEAFQDLKTGSGNDVITGHETSFLPDTIAAGAGDDTITLWNASERDAVDGGVGDDRLVVTGDAYLALYGITENLEGGYDGSYSTGYSNEGVYFSGVEHFSFTDQFGSDNYIATGAGDDRLEGGDGDDTLLGGAGDDTINGGDGFDQVHFNVASTAVSGSGSATTGSLVDLI